MQKQVKDYIPADVIKNPYYFKQNWYKHLFDQVIQVYEKTDENKSEYPFSLFAQKHVNIILEVKNHLIALNHNPKLGWSFDIKRAVHRFDTAKMFNIDGAYAIYIRHRMDNMIFLFIDTKKQKEIPSSEILALKKEGKFKECTTVEKLEILYSI